MQDPNLPIKYLTEEIFIKQGWTKHEDIDEETNSTFEFWTLRIPKDSPDPHCPFLVSSRSDDELEELDEGEFVAEISKFYGLGYCETEDDVKELYLALTGVELSDHMD